MIERIKNWLNRPYYWNDSNAFKLKFSLGIGVFIFIILSVFKPFNINIPDTNMTLIRLLVSLISVISLFTFFFIVTRLFPTFFNENTWTVYKHFLTILSVILLTSIFRWLMINFFSNSEENSITLLQIIKYSFSFSFFPVLFYIYLDEKYHFNKYKKGSEEILQVKKNIIVNNPKKIVDRKISIYASNNKDNLTFKVSDLAYVTSESNYACFFIKNEDKVKEYILRIPLKTVESNLKDFNQIFRCHKSYLVNTSYIDEISGNARGYYFRLKNVKISIPISRKHTKKELQSLL